MRVFKEVQRFSQWWLHLINLSLVILLAYFCYSWYVLKEAVDKVAADNVGSQLLVIVAIVLPIAIIYLLNLKTEINEIGIHYQFYPFQWARKSIRWEDMEDCKVRIYNPIKEFGGWGYRTSFGSGKAYNVKGNQGIQIFLKTGKKLLIGTQKMKEAEQLINRYKHNAQ